MLWLQIALPGIVAAVVTLSITPSVIRWAHRLSALDIPGGRKYHRRTTPRLGGVAIVVGIVIATSLAIPLLAPRALHALSKAEITGFLVASTLILGLGVADDIYSLRPLTKLGVQTMAAMIVVTLGWQFHTIRLPLEQQTNLGVLAPLLSLVWIVGVTNAINLIDGLDGLAAGIVAIVGTSMVVLAALQNAPETVIVMSCVVGACLGFLRHNWNPAKIFMGDSGSLVLGFLLATISLRSTPSVKASATLAILVPILALGLPVIDTLIVMWLRFLRGHHRVNRIARMFHADRAHVHHVLLDNYSERRSVLVVLFSLAALFCGMALWVAASDNWHLGVAFLVLEVVAMILVRRSGMTSATSQMTAREVDQMITSGEVTKCTDIESSQDAPKPPLDAGLEAKTPTVL